MSSTASPVSVALAALASGRDLGETEAYDAFLAVLGGDVPETLVAALLTGLRVKGEAAAELAGAVRAVLEKHVPWPGPRPAGPILDTCGTGGDGACTVNVSTATAIVVASCGVRVAKHGNRSASGNSGSAEVLTELGVNIEARPDVLARCLDELGITFLFAPAFHPALRGLAPIRKQLPFRTIFNLLGPLANPMRPTHQLIGVSGAPAADLMAGALARLATTEVAAIVTGVNDLDEVSLDGPTRVRWVEGGHLLEGTETWNPADFGLPPATAAELRVSGPAESASAIRSFLGGQPGPVRSAVLANSAAALRITGRVTSLAEGVALAANAVDYGQSVDLLGRWIQCSQA